MISMSIAAPLLVAIIVLPLVGFWAYMFRDMAQNEALPSMSGALFEWPPVSRHGWTVLFILFALPAAALYYQTIYRQR